MSDKQIKESYKKIIEDVIRELREDNDLNTSIPEFGPVINCLEEVLSPDPALEHAPA